MKIYESHELAVPRNKQNPGIEYVHVTSTYKCYKSYTLYVGALGLYPRHLTPTPTRNQHLTSIPSPTSFMRAGRVYLCNLYSCTRIVDLCGNHDSLLSNLGNFSELVGVHMCIQRNTCWTADHVQLFNEILSCGS